MLTNLFDFMQDQLFELLGLENQKVKRGYVVVSFDCFVKMINAKGISSGYSLLSISKENQPLNALFLTSNKLF